MKYSLRIGASCKTLFESFPRFHLGLLKFNPYRGCPGFTWVKARGEWGYSFNNINPVGVERE